MRSLALSLILAFVFAAISPRAALAQTALDDKRFVAVDAKVKLSAEMIHAIIDIRGQTNVYAMKSASDESIQTVSQQLQLLLPRGKESFSIWVEKPSRDGKLREILPVHWNGIGAFGNMATNYPLQPGDRIHVCRVLIGPCSASIRAPWLRILELVEMLAK